MKVGTGTVVSFHYTLTNDAGETVDASAEGEPFAYLHGVGFVIAGLEQAMLGRAAGERFNVSVEPEQGYGPRDEGLVQAVPRAAFAGIRDLRVGMSLEGETEHGTRAVVVTHVAPDLVTVDANHPLAGQRLHFDVEITEVRRATAEELAHGHAHGAGGHHHD